MKDKVLVSVCVAFIFGFIVFMTWMFVPNLGVKVYYCDSGTTFMFTDTGKICKAESGNSTVKTKKISNFEKKKIEEPFHEIIDESGKKILFMGDNCYGGCYDYNKTKELREANKAAGNAVSSNRNCVLYGQCNNGPTLSNRYNN